MPELDHESREATTALGLRLACGLALVALFLPWSEGDGFTRDAFGRSGWAAGFALATITGTVVLLAGYRGGNARRWLDGLRWHTGVGAALTTIVAVGVAAKDGESGPNGTDDSNWTGPGLLIFAVVVVAALAHRLERSDEYGSPPELRPRVAAPPLRTVGLMVGAAGFGLAVAGLFMTWERLRSSALGPLLGTDTLTWTGPEVSATLALRWILLAGVVAAVAAVVPRWSRATALPVVLAVAGAAVLATALPRALDGGIAGINATIESGAGAWVTSLGGALSLLGGVAALSALHQRAGRASAMAVASVVLLVVGAAPAFGPRLAAAAASDDGTKVLGDGEGTRLGGRALDADVDFVRDSGAGFTGRASVVATPEGTFFTSTGRGDRGVVLIEQIVDGRTLPVTTVDRVDDLRLLTVLDHRAIAQVRSFGQDNVVSFDLRKGSNFAGYVGYRGPLRSDDRGVLLTETGSDPAPTSTLAGGRIPAKRLKVQLAADGGAYIVADNRTGYRASAATVRSGRPWRVDPAPLAGLAGPGGSLFETTGGGLYAVAPTGQYTPVVGAVSDRRCALSRDPLSSNLSDRFLPFDPPGLAADRNRNVWLLLGRPNARDTAFDVYVRTPDGTLRKPGQAVWHDLQGLYAMPDGSMYLTKKRGGTYRIADPAATARSAPALGPVAPGCVSDNRVRVPDEGRAVGHVRLAPLPTEDGYAPGATVVDPTGTRVYVGPTRRTMSPLIRQTADGRRTTIRAVDNVYIDDVVADGRGGAWWIERSEGAEPSDSRGYLGHVDVSGRAQARLRDVTSRAAKRLVPDSADGSVWCASIDSTVWTRTTPDGRSERLPYPDDASPVIRAGRGYVSANSAEIDTASTQGRGRSFLGRAASALALPAAIVGKVPPARVSATGVIAVAPGGDLLLHQGSRLARIDARGRITVLTSAAAGLPFQAANQDLDEQVVGDRLVIYDGVEDVYSVDVS